MKESGQCPKCQSREIWNNEQVKKSAGNRPQWNSILIQDSVLVSKKKIAFKKEYVCLECGYTETFIDAEGIETIKEYGYPEDR